MLKGFGKLWNSAVACVWNDCPFLCQRTLTHKKLLFKWIICLWVTAGMSMCNTGLFSYKAEFTLLWFHPKRWLEMDVENLECNIFACFLHLFYKPNVYLNTGVVFPKLSCLQWNARQWYCVRYQGCYCQLFSVIIETFIQMNAKTTCPSIWSYYSVVFL